MLRCLHVTNLAILRDVTLDLGPGLNLLTGETGAGKSILVDALLLLLGGRAAADVIRAGEARAAVEAEFDLSACAAGARFLETRGYPSEGGVVIVRRELQAQGKGRCFIGGVLAPLADLRILGSCLVDVHGQHQQQTLLDADRHRDLLDRFAGLEPVRERMAAADRELRTAASRLESIRDSAQRVAQRIDTLRFQIGEIDRAQVRPGERAALRSERERLRHAETILRQAAVAHELLYEGEGAVLARLTDVLRSLRELARFEPAVAEALERAESARAELREMALIVRDVPARLQFEPHRLETLDERLHLLDALLRKYAPGGSEEEIAAHRERAAEELALLSGEGSSATDLAGRVEVLRAGAAEVAGILARARRQAAADLETGVEAELADLALERCRFAVEVRPRACAGGGIWVEGEEVAVDAAGYDVVEFLLAANQGEALRPLASVASGGELSRLMLALEVVLRQGAARRTLVFDEVDAGIGGAVAEAVGRRLRGLARTHQVVCVTHLPQIASWADRHVRVAKRTARGRTQVTLETLDGPGQVRELARMLAGATVTPAALRHAAELRSRGAGVGTRPREADR